MLPPFGGVQMEQLRTRTISPMFTDAEWQEFSQYCEKRFLKKQGFVRMLILKEMEKEKEELKEAENAAN